jgi:UDP-glucose 4-epimerase
MHYIVTGGAGFIGSHIARYLAGQGHDITVIDDLTTGKQENLVEKCSSGRINFIEGSITDSELLNRTFCDADGIFHEAALVSVPWSFEHPLETSEVNITGTLKVLIAARDCSVKKVVFASSSAVYGDNPELPKKESMIPEPKSPYALSKMTGEYLGDIFHKSYGISFVGLRYFNVYGPRQDLKSPYAAVVPKFISRILHGEAPLIFGDGSQTRDFVYVQDVVRANVMAMERNVNGIFNVASGRRISVDELAAIIPALMGRSVRPVHGPERAGDILHSYADISKIKNEFFSPEYSLETGLKETIEWYRNAGNGVS